MTVTTGTATSAIAPPADQFTYEDVPTVSTVSPAAGLPAGGASVVVSGANFTDANAVSFGTLAAASFTVGSASQISAVSPVATGFGTLDVTVTTPSGTSAIAQPADQFTYEQLPSVTTISPLAGPLGGGTALTITGTGFTAATAVSFGTAAAESFTVASSTQIGATSALVTAAATVDVTVSTPNGTSARSAVDQFAYEATPSVTALSPMAGLAGGGSAVTITGTGFSAASAVMFGTTNAASSYSVASSSEITAISPAGTAGTVDVTVTTPVGTSAISPPADQYTYEDVPTVDLVSPVAGPTLGSTLVSISGTDFTDATSVQFGAAAAGGFTVVSPTSMTATSPGTSPGGTAGTVDITVTTPIGTSATTAADQFAYEAVPSVTSVSPLAGLASGGASVTITGTNFTDVTGVSFGSTAATAYAVTSGTSVTATSPAGAGTVDITVTTPVGTSAISPPADQYTYEDVATVTSVSPGAGRLAGGTPVTITGTNFSAATGVSFGSVAAETFSVVSSSDITASSPSEPAGTVDVTVTTPIGTSATSVADQFTYEAVPTVSALSPIAGALTGGTSVVITGTGFTGASAVIFGSTGATSFSVGSSSQVTATSPADLAGGTVDVTVTTPVGTSAISPPADQFTYEAAPSVSSIGPLAGPLAGGTAVTITGTGFTGASAVDFGSAPGTITSASATSVTVTSPAGAPAGRRHRHHAERDEQHLRRRRVRL